LLVELKSALPFLLRYERTQRAEDDYESAEVAVPSKGMTAEALLDLIAEALPEYQVTALPGYVVVYREERDYPSGRVLGLDN
jgi:hypothetical protein